MITKIMLFVMSFCGKYLFGNVGLDTRTTPDGEEIVVSMVFYRDLEPWMLNNDTEQVYFDE